MKRLTIILFATLLCCTTSMAQVNKEVEVTKAYIPTVSKADKPLLEAHIADTAYMSPNVDYNITPLSITTPLQTQPIKPATVTYWEFNEPATAQVKVGAGYPLNSLLQAYWSSHDSSRGYIAAGVDHAGNYSSIENVYAEKISAMQNINSVDLAGGLYIGRRKTLAGALSYLNNSYSNYAFEQVVSPNINYQQVGTSLSYGDSFVNLDRFNYSASLEYDHFYDKASNNSNRVALGGRAGKNYDFGRVLANVDYQSISSSYLYHSNNFGLGAVLSREIWGEWAAELGVQYLMASAESWESGSTHHYFIPQLSIGRSASIAISPYLKIGGEVESNDYSSLALINPYIGAASCGESSVDYNFEGGIEGRLFASKLNYRLFLEYQVGVNSRYWAYLMIDEPSNSSTDIYSGYFDVDYASLDSSSLGVEIGYLPLNNLAIEFDMRFNSYVASSSTEYLVGLPAFESSLDAVYSLRNWNFRVSGRVVGERKFSVVEQISASTTTTSLSSVDLPAAFDLGFEVQWRKSDRVMIFVEASNICGESLYPWPYYRGYGAQATAGVKIYLW